MSTIFNNLTEPFPLNNYDGWEEVGAYDDNKINKIQDTIGTGGLAYFKLGTSIPTPFARIMLFDQAFRSVTDPTDNSSIYGKLVSEALDFLEFIFEYGKDITVKRWSFTDDINALRGIAPGAGAGAGAGVWVPAAPAGTPVTSHTLLADCLQNMKDDLDCLKNTVTGATIPTNEIYLFYYNDILIGGSSPYTLVFTSPNWQRKVQDLGTFVGKAGNQLFPDYKSTSVTGTPLHDRNAEFILFLIEYRKMYGGNIEGCSLFDYVQRDIPYITQRYANAATLINSIIGGAIRVSDYFDSNNNNQKYIMLADNANAVGGISILVAGLFPIAYRKAMPITGSDYEIDADKPSFVLTDKDSAQHEIKNVLVLNNEGLGANAKYIGGKPWDTATIIPENITDVPLYCRTLPGPGNTPQPFICADDIFEKYLVVLPYNVDRDCFETFATQDSKYLLPLKKMFFNFFDIDYLNKHLKITINGDKYTFELRVRVKYNSGNNYLTLVKTYDNSSIKKLGSYAVAVHPSHREMNNPQSNNYTVMTQGDNAAITGLAFYETSDPQSAIMVNKVDRPDAIKSQYYRINQAFDFIEIAAKFESSSVNALIVPKFHKAYLSPTATNDWSFAVDFGTSNTYIAASNNANLVPSTFEMPSKESQVLYLYKINKESDFNSIEYGQAIQLQFVGSFHEQASRGFAPHRVDNGGIACYPFKTIMCESNNFDSSTPTDRREHLFSKISIGFYIDHEAFERQSNYKYRTDIKWAAEHTQGTQLLNAQKRIELYCEQIAWMLKNKIAMHSSDTIQQKDKFTLYFTYPSSMSAISISTMTNAWINALGNNVTVVPITESEAPYYYIARTNSQMLNVANFLNIDIGGGTTDMFFVTNDGGGKTGHYTSVRFAGNDIWGDGVDNLTRMTNGFYTYATSNMDNGKDNIEEHHNMMNSHGMNSSDMMAYIFSHYENDITTLLRSSELKRLLFVHYGAIVYHVAMILNKNNWDIPQTINFTGMGSKYLNIIAPGDVCLKTLTGKLIKKFTGKELPYDFQVLYDATTAKKATAKGAILKNSVAANHQITTVQQFKVLGLTNDRQTYADITDEDKSEIINLFNTFIDNFLGDNEIIRLLRNEFECDITTEFISDLKQEASDSYDTVKYNIRNMNSDIQDTLFFWPLRNAIYRLSMK